MMSNLKLTARCILTFAVLDALFNPLLMVAFVGLFRIDALGVAAFILPLLVLGKILVNSLFLSSELSVYERATGRNERGREDLLLSADRALQRLPQRFGIFYATSWSLTYALAFLAVYVLVPGAFGPRAIDAAGMLVAAVWFGGLAFGFPLAIMLTTAAASDCSLKARERGIVLDRDPIGLQGRIGFVALSLGLGPTLWMMALGYMKEVQAACEQRGTLSALAAPVVSMIASGKPKAKPPNQTAATSMPAASNARGPNAPGTRT